MTGEERSPILDQKSPQFAVVSGHFWLGLRRVKKAGVEAIGSAIAVWKRLNQKLFAPAGLEKNG